MTETILNVLDQQMAMSSDIQKPDGIPIGKDMTIRQQIGDNQMEETQGRTQITSDSKETYPDLFLPVAENHRISDQFCGYLESLSTDNNPMVLVELKSLSYQCGTSIYAVDRVNGTMYGKFSVGYQIIPEKATVIPQFQQTPLEDEYNAMQPTYVSTLPGTTDMVTPIANSMPVTQASQMPVLPNVPSSKRDILEPVSSEQARSPYLERQMQGMSSVRLTLDMPSLEDVSCRSANLPKRIHTFCQEQKEKRKHEWESLKVALEKMKESKVKHHNQQAQEERDATYAQIVQNLEKTRAMVRNSVSRASTISAEEHQLTLTEDDFLAIQRKMDKIDQRLDELYKNWHVEYRDAVSSEDCEEIKKFYKPYLEKYESKYRILYHLLQQPSSFSTQEPTSGITPSLAALDDAQALRQREWIRGEPGEDVPQQHSTISGHLTPTLLRHEDMRLDPSLNVMPEGSLGDLPTAVNTEEAREREHQVPEERPQGAPFETSIEGTPDTHLKVKPERNVKETPRRIQRTREASREDAIAST